ncbi:chloramphenicol acetyltransferase [Olivibacter sp. SDN3]|uniref:CatA-like O-acetyltransferase n=1 Tax=Olivibacter sp. SDN3 TaxID=2764720 RepID=UPI0016510F1A|nr:CatA-like O-acetyltransferase [Olivibacter sp. SDN3]QNL48240.1 chloramphenicol acetyltransferase [Olivibacter sp. SDN3]
MKNEVSFQEVDIKHWKRRAHFDFFKSFEKPLWGVTTQLNCTKAFAFCQANGVSFFYYYLYKSLCAVNNVEAFRLRIAGDRLLKYREIGGSVTVLRYDETFGFAYFELYNDFGAFETRLKRQIVCEKQSTGLQTDPNKPAVVHYSVMPYLSFTQIDHAQYNLREDCIPKITFGQYVKQGQQLFLPMSVHVHHALCDGLDVGKFIAQFQRYLEI